jgi:hypothetical protein
MHSYLCVKWVISVFYTVKIETSETIHNSA